jgi:ATP-dependent Clp protease adaptor protein ClpS
LAWLCGGLYDGSEIARPRGHGRHSSAGLFCNGKVMMSDGTKYSQATAISSGDGVPHMADDDRKRRADQGGPGTAVITKTKPQTKKPSMYRVLILNDDYTPMEFVVHILERFFGKDHEAATRIMLHVHHHGIGECGVYTYEVAETKVTQVMDFARKHQHPLQCVMEKK